MPYFSTIFGLYVPTPLPLHFPLEFQTSPYGVGMEKFQNHTIFSQSEGLPRSW